MRDPFGDMFNMLGGMKSLVSSSEALKAVQPKWLTVEGLARRAQLTNAEAANGAEALVRQGLARRGKTRDGKRVYRYVGGN